MILYTCGLKYKGTNATHPCARALNSLDRAGYEYEHRVVKGYRFVPWTRLSRNKDRAEIKALSGTNEVPVLVLDNGEVVSGSSRIAHWAREHPAAK
jgi:glutathione S-transferase